MCIIIYAPKGNIPKKHLHNSLDHNRDGWGVMWPEDGQLNIVVGLSKPLFFKEWKRIVRIPGPKVFHARIGTHGSNSIDNCHPFRIGGDHDQLGMAHNGIIRQQCTTGSDKSDTRHFIENVIEKLPAGFQKQNVYHVLLADYIGYSNKLVFMDGEGDVNIFNEHQGDWDGDNWYSNRFYKDFGSGTSCGFKHCATTDTYYGKSTGSYKHQPSVPATIASSVPDCVLAGKPEEKKPESDSDLINTPIGVMSVIAYKEQKARRERVIRLLKERQAALREAHVRGDTTGASAIAAGAADLTEAYSCDLL